MGIGMGSVKETGNGIEIGSGVCVGSGGEVESRGGDGMSGFGVERGEIGDALEGGEGSCRWFPVHIQNMFQGCTRREGR